MTINRVHKSKPVSAMKAYYIVTAMWCVFMLVVAHKVIS